MLGTGPQGNRTKREAAFRQEFLGFVILLSVAFLITNTPLGCWPDNI